MLHKQVGAMVSCGLIHSLVDSAPSVCAGFVVCYFLTLTVVGLSLLLQKHYIYNSLSALL